MTLIKSISGIRGTIGGAPGDNLTPLDATLFASAYGTWLKESGKAQKVVIGRDARLSGQMISDVVIASLVGLGIDVVDLGLSTTPTVEIAVPLENAGGGIILTASHNPAQWNALKLLNEKGEFISGADGEKILKIAEDKAFNFVDVYDLGTITKDDTYIDKHIDMILALDLVDVEAVKAKGFKVAVDAVNSTGGIAVPALLEKMGVGVEKLFCEPTGKFPHNPEPLPEHLNEISSLMEKGGLDFGIVVDPDVDRLAFVCEDGALFGEEYTLVAIADYVLQHQPSPTVSNLSSTRALRDVTQKAGQVYEPSAVGEVNVVTKMKELGAKIGGEGNGGIIFPELHYGRDSLVGIALFLTQLAKADVKVSQLRAGYPAYFMSKNKIELTPEIDVDEVLVQMTRKYSNENINTIDGVKIDFPTEWVHLRKSNTEPIIRIYAESTSESTADHLAQKIIQDIKEIVSAEA